VDNCRAILTPFVGGIANLPGFQLSTLVAPIPAGRREMLCPFMGWKVLVLRSRGLGNYCWQDTGNNDRGT
jgi:hypothetical protein